MTTPEMKSTKSIFLSVTTVMILLVMVSSCAENAVPGPYFATGIKIGEVTQNSAIVWVRLTENESRVAYDAPLPVVEFEDPVTGKLVRADSLFTVGKGNFKNRRPNQDPIVSYPNGTSVKTVEGACPGVEGEVLVKYKLTGETDWKKVDWQPVDPSKDYILQVHLDDLEAGQDYELVVEARPLNGSETSATIEGQFGTAPKADEEVDINFVVVTCTEYPNRDGKHGFDLYPHALSLDPDFFVHTGDIFYYDILAKSPELARWHWDRMYSLPIHVDFHRQVPSYFMKDDHDTWVNDTYPGMETKYMGTFTYEQGIRFFTEEVPMGEKTYRTVRWGKDVQLWFVEGRDFRSPNKMEDGPEKTIWGKEQLDWFMNTVQASDATFKLLVSPTPIVGPDRGRKSDNHANSSFKYEGDLIREFVSKQANMYVINGDRHWQYVSKDAETGVIEISVGPGSDKQAYGWEQDNVLPEHLYLNVGGGFVETEISRKTGVPMITFKHYNTKGELLNTLEREAI